MPTQGCYSYFGKLKCNHNVIVELVFMSHTRGLLLKKMFFSASQVKRVIVIK